MYLFVIDKVLFSKKAQKPELQWSCCPLRIPTCARRPQPKTRCSPSKTALFLKHKFRSPCCRNKPGRRPAKIRTRTAPTRTRGRHMQSCSALTLGIVHHEALSCRLLLFPPALAAGSQGESVEFSFFWKHAGTTNQNLVHSGNRAALKQDRYGAAVWAGEPRKYAAASIGMDARDPVLP